MLKARSGACKLTGCQARKFPNIANHVLIMDRRFYKAYKIKKTNLQML